MAQNTVPDFNDHFGEDSSREKPSETAELFRDIVVAPLISGAFQGFFSVAVAHYKEKRAAKKAAQDALLAQAESNAVSSLESSVESKELPSSQVGPYEA